MQPFGAGTCGRWRVSSGTAGQKGAAGWPAAGGGWGDGRDQGSVVIGEEL